MHLAGPDHRLNAQGNMGQAALQQGDSSFKVSFLCFTFIQHPILLSRPLFWSSLAASVTFWLSFIIKPIPPISLNTVARFFYLTLLLKASPQIGRPLLLCDRLQRRLGVAANIFQGFAQVTLISGFYDKGPRRNLLQSFSFFLQSIIITFSF